MRNARALLAGSVATALVLGVVAVLGGVGTAGADQSKPAPSLQVQQVAATGDPVVVSGNLTGADASALTAKVDGKAVDAQVRSGGAVPLDAVVVLDNSAALGNATVQLAKQALAPLLPGKGVVNNLGLVTTGGGAAVQVGGTDSAAAFETALDEVGPVGGSAVWDGMVLAGNLLQDSNPAAQKVVILFTAGPADINTATPSRAETALRQAGAQLDSVVMPRGTDIEAVSDMISVLGGSMVSAANEDELAAKFQQVATTLGGRFSMTFPAGAASGRSATLEVGAGSTKTVVSYAPGKVEAGSANLAPPTTSGGGFLSGLAGNTLVLLLIVALGVVAVILFVWTVLTMVVPDSDRLGNRLQAYEDPYGEQGEAVDDPADAAHATVPILKRAVDFTGDVAQRRGVLEKLEADLERANLPLRGAEALFFAVAGGLLLSVLVLALTRNVIMGILALGLCIMVPRGLLSFRIRRRTKAFEAQLPDMLTLMAGTLRAGYSIGQGFEAVSREIDEPMGRELRRVVSEARLGRPLDEALDAVAERMQSDDFGWAVMAIRIQREVGGNLAELLLTVADTMTQRERLRRDVATLTAEGRMSAIVLGLLPPGLGAIMYVMNKEYMSKLFTPGLGYFMLGGAVIAMGIGFAWMKKIINIEV